MDDLTKINTYLQKHNMNWIAESKEQNKYQLKPLSQKIRYLSGNNSLCLSVLENGEKYVTLSGVIANNQTHRAFETVVKSLNELGFEYQRAVNKSESSKFAKIIPEKDFKKTIDGIEKILQ